MPMACNVYKNDGQTITERILSKLCLSLYLEILIIPILHSYLSDREYLYAL